MKSNELRIGNWVVPDNEDPTSKPYQVDANHFAENVLGDRFYADPIPVSHEWLVENGFTVTETDEDDLPVEWVKHIGHVRVWVVVGIPDGYLAELECAEPPVEGHRWLKYAHEFQNFYFGLMGEEFDTTQPR